MILPLLQGGLHFYLSLSGAPALESKAHTYTLYTQAEVTWAGLGERRRQSDVNARIWTMGR